MHNNNDNFPLSLYFLSVVRYVSCTCCVARNVTEHHLVERRRVDKFSSVGGSFDSLEPLSRFFRACGWLILSQVGNGVVLRHC